MRIPIYLLGLGAAVLLTSMAGADPSTKPQGQPVSPGTLRLGDGKAIQFTDVYGFRINPRVEGGWEATPGKLVLAKKEPEEIKLAEIAQLRFGKEGVSITIELRTGLRRTIDAIVMLEVVEKGTGSLHRFGGSPLEGATIVLTDPVPQK